MSTSTATALETASPLADWTCLFKSRITLFVAIAAAVGAWTATGGAPLGAVAEAAFYITLTSACACALNQVIERDIDKLMDRTKNRPLPTGRISVRDAVFVAALLGVAGVVGLAVRFNLLSALLSLATIAAYTLVYTPIKRYSSFNTLVGAVPGAMAPLLGAVALNGEPGAWGWGLFATLFVWQFPHFFSIAWLYREDYAKAGMRMLPCEPNSEGLAGRQALLYGVTIVPAGLLPCFGQEATVFYAMGSIGLGLCYIAAAAAFAHRESRTSARRLMFTSLLYLPCLFAVALVDRLVIQL